MLGSYFNKIIQIDGTEENDQTEQRQTKDRDVAQEEHRIQSVKSIYAVCIKKVSDKCDPHKIDLF